MVTAATPAEDTRVLVRLPHWFIERHNLVSRELEGVMVARTSRAILFRGKAVVRESRFCLRCDREITNPASILVGYGPECAKKLLIGHPGRLDPTDAAAVRAALEQMGDVEIWIPLSVGQIIDGELFEAAPKPAPPPNLRIELVDGELSLTCPYEDREKAKCLHGRWHKGTKTWRLPARPEVLEALQNSFPLLPVPDEVRAAVERVRRAEEAVAELKEAEDAEIDVPTRLPLYAHQRRMVAMALTLPSMAWFAEMGVGKTPAAIAVAGRRFLDGQIQSCLVVAPKSVLPVWEREFKVFADFPYQVKVLEESIAEREKQLAGPWPDGALRVAVVNYEATWRMEEALARFVQGGMIIADESHRIKTPGAQQSKAMGRLGQVAAYRLMLTGTPVTQNPLDLWSQYRFLDPSIFPRSFYAFRNRYAIMGGYQNYQIVGYRNLDELVEKAHKIAFRITRAECLDLPPEVYTDIPVQLGSKARYVYRELEAQAVARLTADASVTAPNILTELLRLQQVAGGWVTTDDGRTVQVGTEKLDALMDLLEDLLSNEQRKVVVFCRFVPEIKAILDACQKVGIPAEGLFGETRDRGELVRRFQEEAEPRVMVIQIQTGGLGITLHRADTAIFYSTGWSLADYEQAKARIQRAGQTAEKVQYFHLLAQGTVDERIKRALADKRDLSKMVVDEWREIISGRREA